MHTGGVCNWATYFAVVSLQVVDIFKCSWWVDLDDVAMDSSKQMTTIAERTLKTKTKIDSKFFKKQTNKQGMNLRALQFVSFF